MTSFLLIETRHDSGSDRFLADALSLSRAGRPVTVFLVADAVALAVRGADAVVPELVSSGARLWVDDFTLAQRALTTAPLEAGVTVAEIARTAELVTTSDVTVVWH